MKKIIITLIAFVLILNVALAQYPEGKVVYDHLYSELLENQAGENPTRRVTVYLPPGYEKSEQRYPVIYFLHCFTCSDSIFIVHDHLDKLLDKAMSPAVLGLYKDNGIKNIGFRRVQELTTREEVITGYKEFGANAKIALGQAFSPNPDNPPFYADMPVTYNGDTIHINYDILELWKKNMPLEMVDSHIENLRKINALKLDWGRNEENDHIPYTCKMLSQKLENLGIEHYAEEYIGTHINKLFTDDGRILNDVLPFFDTYLKFE